VVLALLYTKVTREDEDVLKVVLGDRFGYARIADGDFLWKEQGFGLATPQ
jgi:hypothetical protein